MTYVYSKPLTLADGIACSEFLHKSLKRHYPISVPTREQFDELLSLIVTNLTITAALMLKEMYRG